jgi:hypothetical protein
MAELTRAEAIGLYRNGSIAALPQSPAGTTITSNSRTPDVPSVPGTTHRRPRAGTLPSNFSSLSAAATPHHAVSHHPSRTDLLRQYNLLAAGNPLSAGSPLLSIASPALYDSAAALQDSRFGSSSNHLRSDMSQSLASRLFCKKKERKKETNERTNNLFCSPRSSVVSRQDTCSGWYRRTPPLIGILLLWSRRILN